MWRSKGCATKNSSNSAPVHRRCETMASSMRAIWSEASVRTSFLSPE